MKTKRCTLCIIALCLACGLSIAHAQILTLQEITRDGERLAVSFADLAVPIIDINSSLLILVDKQALRERAGKMKPFDPPVKSEQIQAITAILQQESQLLALIGPSVRSFDERRKDLRRFSEGMSTVFGFVKSQATLASKVNEMMGLGLDPSSEYQKTFAIVREEMNRLGQVIKGSANDQQIFFRLGGWIQEQDGPIRPIHIPEFDSYSEGTFHEVPRFVMPTPEELRKQYEAAVKAADEYNKSGSGALDGLKQQIAAAGDSLHRMIACLRGVADEVLNVDPLKREIAEKLQPLVKSVQELLAKIERLRVLVEEVGHSSNPLQTALLSIDETIVLLGEVTKGAGKLPGLFKTTLDNLGNLLKEKAESIKTQGASCTSSMQPVLNYIDTVLLQTIRDWQKLGVPQQVAANLEFGEQVKRFLIDDVPELTTLDLRYTGQRSPGDQVYLRAAFEDQAQGVGASRKLTELEKRALTMFQVDWHARLGAGVVLLDPLATTNVKISKQFQAAPSFSLIASKGSRSSYMYNRFWNVGVGLNLAAPDFDLDSNPEMAFGLVVSSLMDYAQVGVGRNFGVDTWYWFFGLRLPVGSLSVPTVSTTEDVK